MRKHLKTAICFWLVLTLVFSASGFARAENTDRSIYCNEDYIYEVFADSTVTVHYYIGSDSDVSLPSYIDGLPVVSVQARAFYGTQVKRVTVSEGIKALGDEVFWGCGELEAVTLPATLQKAGKGVFRYCTSLKSVSFSQESGVLGEYMFYGCMSLESVNLPESLTSIPAGAFSYCQSLKELYLPEGISTIDGYAFYTSGLEAVVLPLSLRNIHTKAFANSISLGDIVSRNKNYDYVAADAFVNCKGEFPYYTVEVNTDPSETQESVPGATAPDSGDYYIGGTQELILHENSEFSLAQDSVEKTRAELLSLAWNVRTIGDANNDNTVNIRDATQIQRYAASLISADDPDFNYKNADVDTDGKVTVKDATQIQKFAAQLIESLY